MIRHGEVWWASLGTPRGSGPGYRRPVLVIQSDAFNRSSIGTVMVAAITSNLRLGDAPGNVRLTRRESKLARPSVVNVSQVLTIAPKGPRHMSPRGRLMRTSLSPWSIVTPSVTLAMIKTFAHKGLAEFFESGNKRGIQPHHAPRLGRILDFLSRARVPRDMGLPGFGLHPLSGRLEGFWSVEVSGNWRVVFRLESGDAYDVDYGDYH